MVGCQENGERGCEGKRGGGKKREGERKEEREGTYSHVYGGGGRRKGSVRWRKMGGKAEDDRSLQKNTIFLGLLLSLLVPTEEYIYNMQKYE